ncbi:MAG: hypothetical protein CL783_00240 [Chloroflexi bacterium]|nr:hypothetical protein [Chloroflexota bacterium]|tara:strand:+ start:4083 stop:5333 length:1251 start_codon:yes stop_codon:yes gene_type:complete
MEECVGSLIGRYLSGEHNKEAVASAIQNIAKSRSDPREYYLAVVVLEEIASSDIAVDDKIRQGLESAFSSPKFSYKINGDEFVDACRRYARLLFKYQDFVGASNFLGLASDLGDKEPGWVPNYQAKLTYILEAPRHFNDPSYVLEMLAKGVVDEQARGQSIAVFKEYLVAAREYFDGKIDDKFNSSTYVNFEQEVKTFVDSCDEFSSVLDFDIGYITKASPSEQAQEDDRGAQSDREEHQIGRIEELEQTILSLERNLEKLREENVELRMQLSGSVPTPELDHEPRQGFPARFKILVIGVGSIKLKDVHGIAKQFGLTKDHIEWINEFKSRKVNPNNLQWNCPYAGILVGPTAHKVAGLGNNVSLLEKLKSEGYPPTEPILTKSGGFKITKTAFNDALENLLIRIQANDPELPALV